MSETVRLAVRVEGIVQGVGFRPFVHALATGLALGGHVGNDASGVFAEVEGTPAATRAFLAGLREQAPALAVIERVEATEIAPRGASAFAIVASPNGAAPDTLISADSATCAECLAELFDPTDRRYRYPFVNCTNCGPRFTIVTGVPYDRPRTTMAGFAMCGACAAEYADPTDRRFHAQPVCCPACGPRVSLHGARLTHAELPETSDPLAATAALLAAGQVVAIKGLGGFHLAVDATHPDAAAALRARKHREDKPFAVMVPDVATAEQLCEVDTLAAELLGGRRRPIVLLPRKPGASVAEAVAPGARDLGLMLPYTPLHHLLLAEHGKPIVLTSGNVSDEPIAYEDTDAADRLGTIADAIITHDRAIHTRTDDSIVRPVAGRAQLQRRSRGYAPEPLLLRTRFPRPVLACGAELKNTFCLGKDRHAFLSHHIGDLENYETLRAFTDGIAHFTRLFHIAPEVVAYDLHPDYLSTKYALELSDVELIGVQHHHAHIAACLAEHGHARTVLGVAFDGTGYGSDGTGWGGEFLIADLADFQRSAYFQPVPMPGGAAAIKQPWRMAASYLDAAYGPDLPENLDVWRRNEGHWSAVLSLARSATNAPLTSSAGRLFDAVAALLGVRDSVNYEGQAAIELEQLAEPAETGRYPLTAPADPVAPCIVVPGVELFRCCADDLLDGASPAIVAARFHTSVAWLVTEVCGLLREATGLDIVALSGGVFANLMLLERTVARLRERGFTVLTHERVPPGDGGISLGQAAIAAARDRRADPSD